MIMIIITDELQIKEINVGSTISGPVRCHVGDDNTPTAATAAAFTIVCTALDWSAVVTATELLPPRSTQVHDIA